MIIIAIEVASPNPDDLIHECFFSPFAGGAGIREDRRKSDEP